METIFAPINNHNNSTVCTIRISGSMIFAMEKFIPALSTIKHRYVKRVKIFDNDGLQLDDALILFFASPNSFTGEDILEVSLHASPFIVAKFLSMLSSINGFRFAKAGEFCFRAVENKKISLNEAETINKLILSESAVKHRLAIQELNGICQDYYTNIKHKLIKILSLLETFIDFSEEESISQDFISSIEKLNNELLATIRKTIKFSEKQSNYDLQIAILGKPNVGKSTLFNLLSETDDAIVSDIAGTTRDALRKILHIAGFKVELVDTAGLHEEAEKIEQIGIERAKKIAMHAEIILLLKENIDEDVCDLSLFKGKILTVLTKSDLHGVRTALNNNVVNISYNNIAPLEKELHTILENQFHEIQSIGFLCNARQKIVLQQTHEILVNIDFQREPELLSEEFRHALHTISFLTGEVNNEDILGDIFSNFCIGK